ncbi:hypothetical protein QJS66_03340 [Kocuria rhizophila]|nr:hypothetical protein QJS66_03340 [Kocuria rhizophila]
MREAVLPADRGPAQRGGHRTAGLREFTRMLSVATWSSRTPAGPGGGAVPGKPVRMRHRAPRGGRPAGTVTLIGNYEAADRHRRRTRPPGRRRRHPRDGQRREPDGDGRAAERTWPRSSRCSAWAADRGLRRSRPSALSQRTAPCA